MSYMKLTDYQHDNRQQYILVLSYKPALPPKSNYNYNAGKSSGICWLLCCLLVQLIYVTQCVAQSDVNHNNVAERFKPSIDNVGDAVQTAALNENHQPRVSERSQYSTFSELDKEVGMFWYLCLRGFKST